MPPRLCSIVVVVGSLFLRFVGQAAPVSSGEERVKPDCVLPQMSAYGYMSKSETRQFQEFLTDINYDHAQRPPSVGDEPFVVEVSIMVGSIRSVSEVTMDYQLELFYREYWTDPRLAFDPARLKNKTEIHLHESYASHLWRPDTFFPNALNAIYPKEDSIVHKSLLRLQSGGQILYSRRISVHAECPMDLTLFPFDQQICELAIESYGYRQEEVMYRWRLHEGPSVEGKDVTLPDFVLTNITTKTGMGLYSTGNYSRLFACFKFKRNAGFCFLQLIIPAAAIVISSWVSLWMENETTFQDMISVILTITFLIFSYNTVMPRVAYIKAMDIYLGACFFFVFLSLIKLAIVKYMRQRLQVPRDASVALHHLLPFAAAAAPAAAAAAAAAAVNGDARRDSDDSEGRNRAFSFAFGARSRCLPSIFCSWKFVRKFHLASQILFPICFFLFCFSYFVFLPLFSNSNIVNCCHDPNDLVCG